MKTNKIDRLPHDQEWQLQEAKNRLSQVVDLALHAGPQTITLRGKPSAVVVSFDEYRRLTHRAPVCRSFSSNLPCMTLNLISAAVPISLVRWQWASCQKN